MATQTSISRNSQEQTMIPTQTGRPTCIIVLGMSGSGKTTFVQNLVSKFYETGLPYVINLDPACEEVPYPPNIDIRDTINYKDVMTRYGLSLNDGIITTLNLFSTKFNEVIEMIENDGEQHEYIVVDAPGQTEIFTWSASGNIITQALASRFPTIVIYIMDTVSSVDPVTFMSNIMNACSIMCKLKLPFIMVMNKIDIMDHSYAMKWFRDVEAFQEALNSEVNYCGNKSMTELISSLHEFFYNLKSCGVSARTGEGIPIFFELLRNAVEEYNLDHDWNQDEQSAERAFEHGEKSLKLNALSGELDRQEKSTPLMAAVPHGQVYEAYIDDDDSRKVIRDFDGDGNKADSFKTFLRFYKKQLEKHQIRQYVEQ